MTFDTLRFIKNPDVRDALTLLATTPLPALLAMAGFDPVQVLIDPARRVMFKSDQPGKVVFINPQGAFEHDWRGSNNVHKRVLSDGYFYNNLARKHEHIADVRKVLTQRLGEPLPTVRFGKNYVDNEPAIIDIEGGNHYSYAVFCILRDMGFTAIPVNVQEDDAAWFAARYPAVLADQTVGDTLAARLEPALPLLSNMMPVDTIWGQAVKPTRPVPILDDTDEMKQLVDWTSLPAGVGSGHLTSNVLILMQHCLLHRMVINFHTLPDTVLGAYAELTEQYHWPFTTEKRAQQQV